MLFSIRRCVHCTFVACFRPDGRLVHRDHISERFKPWDVPLGLDVYRPLDYTSPYVYYFSSAAAEVGPYFKWASDQSDETIARQTRIATRELKKKYGVELLVDPHDSRPLNPSGRQVHPHACLVPHAWYPMHAWYNDPNINLARIPSLAFANANASATVPWPVVSIFLFFLLFFPLFSRLDASC